ncbi:MAG: S-layer homology domain-containing protein, partial [Lawsonibacter sp.]
TDGSGDPIQAMDESGNPVWLTDETGAPLYLDQDGNQTTQETDSEGNFNTPIPVYEMVNVIQDSDIFETYWNSMTQEEKLALLDLAWDLAHYPQPRDDTTPPRDLNLHIGQSTGESYLLNTGDIHVTQDTGTFTAAEVVSTHGDVTIISQSIAGVAAEQKEEITDEYVLGQYAQKLVGEKLVGETAQYGTDANVYGEEITLAATAGDITGLTTEQRSWPETTIGIIENEDNPPTNYPASGTWSMTRDTDGKIVMIFVIDYTAVRDVDLESAGKLNATAAGNIQIAELTGDMGVDHVKAGGTVSLTAPGNILDVRTHEAIANIIAGLGDSALTAGGTIGAGPEDRIDVKVDGTLYTDAQGDVNLNAIEDLNLVSDSKNGQVNVDGTGDLNLRNTGKYHDDLTIGAIQAQGDVSITAEGGIVLGDRLGRPAQIEGVSISIMAKNGSVGDAEYPVVVDTDSVQGGTLSVRATNGTVFVDELDGDVLIGTIQASGDETNGKGEIQITSPGSITVGTVASAGGGNVTLTTQNGAMIESAKIPSDTIRAAAEAILAAAQAQAKADALQDQCDILARYVILLNQAKIELETAKANLDQSKAELAVAQQDLTDRQAEQTQAAQDVADAEQNLAQAEAELETAKQTQTEKQAALTEANDELVQAETELEALKQADPQDAQAIEAQELVVGQAQDAAGQAQIEAEQAEDDVTAAQTEVSNREGTLETAKSDLETAKTATADAQTQVKEKEAAVATREAEAKAAIAKADTDTFGKVSGLKDAPSIEDAITAVSGELGTKQTELSSKQTELSDAQAQAQSLRDQADVLAGAAVPSGIIAEGDLNLELTLADGGTVSIGEADNALGTTVGGKLNVSTGENTSLADVYLESGSDLELNPISASGQIRIDSLGSITGTGNSNTITAAETILNSVHGTVGTSASSPLRTSVDQVTASGEHVWIRNDKSLAVGTMVGGSVGLTVSGDVTSGTPMGGDSNIVADDLNIKANSNIGTPDDRLIVESGEISTDSDNAFLGSEGNLVVDRITASGTVDLSSGGIVSDKGTTTAIDASQLKIDAGGGIGAADQPLNVSVSGQVTAEAGYGTAHIKNSYTSGVGGGGGGGGIPGAITLIHEPTGVRVSGTIGEDAILSVTDPAANTEDAAYRYLNQIRPDKALAYYQIKLEGTFSGKLTVQIPVDTKYEGKELTVITCLNGRLTTENLTVKDGFVTFTTETLSSYMVLDGKYTVTTYGKGQFETSNGVEYPLGAKRFADVAMTDWFYPYVAYVSFLGMMAGVSDTEFAPNSTATRGMMVTILYRLVGASDTVGDNSFRDVAPDSWYAKAAVWAKQQGVTAGFEDGTFRPDASITREQFVTMLYSYAKNQGYDVSARADLSTFQDSGEISGFAKEAMSWAVAVGLVSGRSDIMIAARDTATRGELAVIIQRFTECYGPKSLIINESLLESGK